MSMEETGFTQEEAKAFEAMRTETPVEVKEATVTEPKVEEKPEAKVDTDTDQKPEKQGFVPQQALHEERKTRQELQREFEQYRAQTESRFQQMMERLQPKQQEQVAPDPETDPIGAIKAQREELERIRQYNNQFAQHQQAQAQIQHITSRAAALEREFVEKNNDYNEASQHLLKSRDQELQYLGMMDPVQRQQTIQAETIALANMALQQGQNPAEVVYTLAKQRGFTPKPAAPAANPEAEKLARIAEGQKAGQSLGSATGAAPAAEVSAKVLANMSDDDFDKFMSSLSPAKQREYLGS